MSKLLTKRHISVSGKFDECRMTIFEDEQNLNGFPIFKTGTTLFLTWILDMYSYKHIQRTQLIEKFNQAIFLTFYGRKLSWNQASDQCKIIGGHLPVFASRVDLDLLAYFKITKYLKHEDHMEPIFQMYIGLRDYSNKLKLYKAISKPLRCKSDTISTRFA